MKHATSTSPPKTELCKLFFKYKSDKCPQIYHTYSEEYDRILSPVRSTVRNMLEIGIGTKEMMVPIAGDQYEVGASIFAWRDYFHNAQIYAVDIDVAPLSDLISNIKTNKITRINPFYMDQSSVFSIKTQLRLFPSLDVVVDDGSHVLEHQILTMETIAPFLKTDAIYIIEDVLKQNIQDILFHTPPAFKLIYTHEGVSNGDVFLAFKKI